MTFLGYLHVPKCAGSSLNQSIFDATGLVPFHIVGIIPPNHSEPDAALARFAVRGSLSYKLACNCPYVPGHLTYSELKELKRNFIFTVFRDPRKRLISIYTYAKKRASSELVLRNFPNLKVYADMSFIEFMKYRKPENGMTDILMRDIDEYEAMSETEDRHAPSAEFMALLEKILQRLDVIYACSNQAILDDLHARSLIPKSSEVWKNVSEDLVEFGGLGSRDEFIEILNQAVWQDILMYRIAQRLFPATMLLPLGSDDEIISQVENRFGARFTG